MFDHIVKTKKPIVGHNMLLDLLHLYKAFYEPLPDSVDEFKQTIHSLFPVIYDTKLMASYFPSLQEIIQKTTIEGIFICK